MTETRGWVVAVFGGEVEGWCDLSHCPMYVVGQFATNTEAKAYANTCPPWQRPHVLAVQGPESETVGEAERT